ncbi:phosphopantetheine-binding protein [Pseudomonas aeruginosa]|nr:phosphopantetheine-binding protein [Pseudomonas aeruginosa]
MAGNRDEDAQAALARELSTSSSNLPDYMVPAHLLLLAGLPLTASGKLDRRARCRRPTRRSTGRPTRARAALLEQQLAGVWREVLNVERVGLGDNFFELGGDSILSIGWSAARQLGIHFSPATCSRPDRAEPRRGGPAQPGQPGRARGGAGRATR